jgi:uncharacterized protein DUF4055
MPAQLMTTDENKPDYKCAAHTAMIEDLTVVRDVERGTAQMRKKQEKYLPKWPGEKPKQYLARVRQSFFFNTYRKIRNGLVGMINDPVLGNDVDQEIATHMENVDLAGTHLDVFTKELEKKAMEGHCFIFVDMEKPLPAGSTAKQAEIANRRPYWILYPKDAAINWTDDRINGEQVLTQITFEECATVQVGKYGQAEVYQYRVLYLPVTAIDKGGRPVSYGPMAWELYRRKDGDKNELELIDQGKTKLPRIPVVAIYTCRREFMQSDPLLLDLAHLNIAHYQEWSDLRTQQRSLVPILVVKKVEQRAPGSVPPDTSNEQQPEELQIGPNVSVDLYGEHDDVKYVSHDGKAVEVARQNIIDLEQRMSTVGLSLIAPADKVEVTATDKVIDQKERTSELGDTARAVQDGLEAALEIHARYMGKTDGGSVTVTIDTGDTSSLKPESALNGDKGGNPQPPAPAPSPQLVQ